MATALIVEDDRDQAEVVMHLLRGMDLIPMHAETGAEALRMAAQERPTVIILDLMLPDIDGFEVCRRLRADAATLATPIVMLTALGEAMHRHRGLRVGANAYLSKPYDPEDLRAALAGARAWEAGLRGQHVRGEIVVEFQSVSRFLQEVNEFLGEVCRGTPMAAEQAGRLRHAVMELGMNAIEWGNKYRPEAVVTLLYRAYDDRVEVAILDEGPGFDREALPHAASGDDPTAHMDVREALGLREGGFGMMISRGLVDDLRYNDAGNEVTLTVRFDAAAPGP